MRFSFRLLNIEPENLQCDFERLVRVQQQQREDAAAVSGE